jgi:hypothetical protein
MTQENDAGVSVGQERVELNGQQVWVDPSLKPLLIELNRAGLITRSHCSGHGESPAWVAIRMDSILEVTVRNDGIAYDELLITWDITKGRG